MAISVEADVYIRGKCDKCDDEFLFGPVTIHAEQFGGPTQNIMSALANRGLNVQEDGSWKCWECITDEDSERGTTEETPSV